jgi:hypothetical protein
VLPAAGARQAKAPPVKPTTFTLTALQAAEVSVVAQFIAAYNARQLRKALALFTPDANASDCDYKNARGLKFGGRQQVSRWLQQRFADRDHLVVSRIYDKNPQQPLGVVVIEYARRTNNTLRALGFPNGIIPPLASKIGFSGTAARVQIQAFGNGPWDGPDKACRPPRR